MIPAPGIKTRAEGKPSMAPSTEPPRGPRHLHSCIAFGFREIQITKKIDGVYIC